MEAASGRGRAWLITLIATILGSLLKLASEHLKEKLPGWLNQLEAWAKETDNPFDDMFVATLKEVLKIE